MRIIVIICTAVLIMEFVLHGLAMYIGMEAGIQPLQNHFGFRPSRALTLLIAVLDTLAAAGLVIGIWRPGIGAIAAGYTVAFFGMMLILRFYRNLGGILPPDFPLFFALGVVVLVLQLMR
ncbi:MULTISPECIES: hypothetical protein [unclassified Solwaraspora]|uniref:hypothetical protein n=1 Tax=unclassified Solwaraspora TaxID=2627926 RepID=UPI00248C0A1A|nr:MULTISPECIES: hypothetical protein [unclassified Solwaraspora]WBB95682.1 hypothetical protein O7553_20220 [Solwaraspora sp. WMMA2059]WBC20415.1 hypothetical protein O7543_27160 [Solwaraspora sp. WMMA2080]WJK37432.1 hypothetical protein O7610_14420 [Solwaraspora sp. WMMA2065]